MTSKNLLSFALFFLMPTAFAQTYLAPITDSQWHFSGDRVSCQLDHTIPEYGTATFEQRSGERVDFILEAKGYVPPLSNAVLTSVAPVWMHNKMPVKLGAAKGSVKKTVIKGDMAERMLQELSSGRFTQFNYKGSSGRQKVEVAVSSVNFLQAKDEFESCRQDLLQFSRNDVNQKMSLFEAGTSHINHKNRRFLNKASAYVKAAGEGQRIEIISGTGDFSVKKGRAMLGFRENKIKDFLVESGVAEDKIVILSDPEELDTPSKSVRLKVAGSEPFQQIFFREGSIKLNDRDHKKMDFMLSYLKSQHPSAKLLLKGHTDSDGPRQANLIVSKKRVNEIKKYLVSKGMDKSRIITKAYGESRPATTNRYPGGRQLNRRVEISIKG